MQNKHTMWRLRDSRLRNLYRYGGSSSPFRRSKCGHCLYRCYWYEEGMIVPSEAPAPLPHEDFPESCATEYNAYKDIVARSPRAAAALLRLAIQKLMSELGESGEDINHDIGSLVAEGLPVEVQQTFNYCRVIGNNAVNSGEIELSDDADIAHNLSEIIDFIVEGRISRLQKVKNLYQELPAGA